MNTRNKSFDKAAIAAASNFYHSIDEESRIDLVEAAAAAIAGWDLKDYRSAIPRARSLSVASSRKLADEMLEHVSKAHCPLPIALASATEPIIDSRKRKRSGVFFTEVRLAEQIATRLLRNLSQSGPIVDPACGNGALLASLSIAVSNSDPENASTFVADRLCAVDLSAESLIVTKAVVASTLVSSDALNAIEQFAQRCLQADSLLLERQSWDTLAPDGFAGVIGNPPWEKLKSTIHEHTTESHMNSHYGSETTRGSSFARESYDAVANHLREYALSLRKLGRASSKGELDLFGLFTELAVQILKPGGSLSFLVPAGLIRSLGTKPLRECLLNEFSDLEITIHDNRPGYFEIDSRFKFVTLSGVKDSSKADHIVMNRDISNKTSPSVAFSEPVQLEVERLRTLSPALTIPEVKDSSEWGIFCKIHDNSETLANWEWDYKRELDMTNDRDIFERAKDISKDDGGGYMPLIEGRMVHQYRWRAKKYVSGTGRSALWIPQGLGDATVSPQYWLHRTRLPDGISDRVGRNRVGICDVTGQTNERTTLASIIPPGVACGNKVPTLRLKLPTMTEDESEYLWVAIANSFVFDWIVRKSITTTLNKFLLEQIPVPKIGSWADQVISWSQELQLCEGDPNASLYRLQELRAKIDRSVAVAYTVSSEELETILQDFPQLDNGSSNRCPTSATSYAIRAQFGDGNASNLLAELNSNAEFGYVPNQFRTTLGTP